MKEKDFSKCERFRLETNLAYRLRYTQEEWLALSYEKMASFIKEVNEEAMKLLRPLLFGESVRITDPEELKQVSFRRLRYTEPQWNRLSNQKREEYQNKFLDYALWRAIDEINLLSTLKTRPAPEKERRYELQCACLYDVTRGDNRGKLPYRGALQPEVMIDLMKEQEQNQGTVN